MARNRIIYQSEALFAGPSPATGYHFVGASNEDQKATGYSLIHQIQRVQDASYSFNITRQDVNQFGELAAIDRVILESPTVSLDFSYILASMINEHHLGFHVTPSGSNLSTITETSALSGILSKVTDERNYFIKTVAEGDDAIGDAASNASSRSVIGIGNAFLTSYTTEAAVGDFPTASISVEGLNMSFDPGTSGNNVPAIKPFDGSKVTDMKYVLPSGMSHATTGLMMASATHTADGEFGNDNVALLGTSALRPGDVSLDILPQGGSTALTEITGMSITDAKIQSYSLSFDLAREPLAKLGNKFAFAREITFPVTVTLTIDANLGDLTDGNLADVISIDSSYDALIKVGAPGAGTADGANTRMSYKLLNCKLDSQEYTSDVGTNKAVSLTFSSQIGGPKQTDKGLFMSGVYKV